MPMAAASHSAHSRQRPQCWVRQRTQNWVRQGPQCWGRQRPQNLGRWRPKFWGRWRPIPELHADLLLLSLNFNIISCRLSKLQESRVLEPSSVADKRKDSRLLHNNESFLLEKKSFRISISFVQRPAGILLFSLIHFEMILGTACVRGTCYQTELLVGNKYWIHTVRIL